MRRFPLIARVEQILPCHCISFVRKSNQFAADCFLQFRISLICKIAIKMKLTLTLAILSTLLLSSGVQAAENTGVRGLNVGNMGGGNGGDGGGGGMKKGAAMGMNGGGMGSKAKTYFSVINAAQEVPLCSSSALGNAVATVEDGRFCIALSYNGLSGTELFSHVHGPAAIGEAGPVIIPLNTGTQKTQCFDITDEGVDDLDDKLWYFNIHSEMCPSGEIRGQILPAC
jgi:hypothetical protein